MDVINVTYPCPKLAHNLSWKFISSDNDCQRNCNVYSNSEWQVLSRSVITVLMVTHPNNVAMCLN